MPDWTQQGLKYVNEYYLEKANREFAAMTLSKEDALKYLHDAGVETYEGGAGLIGYRIPGRSCGVLMGIYSKDVLDSVIADHHKYIPTPQEPIVLKDTYRLIWRWFRGH